MPPPRWLSKADVDAVVERAVARSDSAAGHSVCPLVLDLGALRHRDDRGIALHARGSRHRYSHAAQAAVRDRGAVARGSHSAELVEMPAKMARWVLDHRASLAAWDGVVPKGLNDRAADNWRPLLAVADLVGRNWPGIARAAAEALTGSEPATESTGQLLLADVHEIFERRRVAVEENDERALLTRAIVGELIVMEERPWGAYGKAQKQISDVQLARLLKAVRSAIEECPDRR